VSGCYIAIDSSQVYVFFCRRFRLQTRQCNRRWHTRWQTSWHRYTTNFRSPLFNLLPLLHSTWERLPTLTLLLKTREKPVKTR
jgi:hypothetical protein